MHKYVDVEMVEAETVERENKEKDEMTDAAKADDEKTSKEKGDVELAGNAMTSDYQDSADAKISSLMDVHIQQETLQIQSPSVLKVHVLVIPETTTFLPIPEIPTKTMVSTTLLPPHVTPTILIMQQTSTPIPTPPITTDAPTNTTAVPESDALFVVQLRVAKLEKDVSELKKIDHSAEALAFLKSQVPTVVEHYLGSKISDDLQKVLQKHTTNLIQKYFVMPTPESSKIQKPTIDRVSESKKSALEIRKIKKEQDEKQKMPKYTIKSTDKAALKDYDLKSALYQTMNENKSFNKNPGNHAFYHALIEDLIEDENAMDKGVADTVKNYKRRHDDDKNNYEDPSVGPNQGKKTKRRRTKELEISMKPSNTKETSKGKAPSKSSKIGKSATIKKLIEEPIAEVVMDDLETNKNEDVVNDVDQGDHYPFELTKPLPLKGRICHLTVAAEYFFNNDMEFLKLSDLEKKYTTSITKTKAAQYKIVGIEDMVPTLWSPTKVGYDKDALKGMKHWGDKRQLWYRSQINKYSKHNVYSTQKILGVKSVSVKKLHGYGHLEEIVVKRADRQLYKFKESNFVDLHLNDIENMLLLAVQHKLFHLDGSDIVDFIVARRMFIRSLIIKRCVEDLQLGVKSYQKKLNITKPQKTFLEIEFKELYTPSHKPHGTVRNELHHRILDFRLGCNKEMSRRKWTAIDKKRSELMVELIDKQMWERRII
ncbi:hypothetical protein Tco_1483088 [Tanacetum coccineum]